MEKKAQLAAIRMSGLSENYCPFMRDQGNSAEINLCWEYWQIWWVAESVHGKKEGILSSGSFDRSNCALI